MKLQGIQNSSLKLRLGGITAILLSTGAMAALMVGMPSVAAVSPAPTFSLEVPADEARPRYRNGCEHCAVITTIGEIEPLEHGIHSGAGSRTTADPGYEMTGESAKRYEVTVRMRDGSIHVIDQGRPVNWRVNERLIVIGGIPTRNESKTILSLAGDGR